MMVKGNTRVGTITQFSGGGGGGGVCVCVCVWGGGAFGHASRNILIASEPNLDIYLKRLYSDPTALSSEAILMTLVPHGN